MPLRVDMKVNKVEKLKERYIFLEQDIIVKALILVYLKMLFNFDNYPLLVALPIEQISPMLTSPEERKQL